MRKDGKRMVLVQATGSRGLRSAGVSPAFLEFCEFKEISSESLALHHALHVELNTSNKLNSW
jgi:hypothetical protein